MKVRTHQFLKAGLKIARAHLRTSHPSSDKNQPNTAKMGRVRTKTVKKSAKVIIERYYPKLTLDFETNKRICDEIAIIASKRLRNKVSKRQLDKARAQDGLTDSGLANHRLPATRRI